MSKGSDGASGPTIGGLAKAAGVNVETIRYYHRIGLLRRSSPALGGARRYSNEDFRRLRFIRRAQGLGFSLEEVRLLLGLSDGTHCAETRTLADTKLRTVNAKIEQLTAIQRALDTLVKACSKGSHGAGCPIIDALANGE